MANTLSNLRVSDPVITQVVHGYVQAESVAPFVAPIVPVNTRSGKIVKFTKDQFAVIQTLRSPGDEIKRISVNYTSDNFTVNQHAAAGKVTEEEYEEAINGEARVDLRSSASIRAAQAVMQSWELEVIGKVTDPSNYEPTCTSALSGTDQFTNPACDPEVLVADAKEEVRAQVGVYPNSAILSPRAYNALKHLEIFRDRIKYTSSGSVNLDMLAQWLDLPRGIKIASRVYLAPDGTLKDFMNDSFLLFYQPEGTSLGQGLLPVNGADRAVPSFAYTYGLKGYPIATPERYDSDTRSYITDVISEQSLQLTGLGTTNKVGAGFLFTNVLA